MKFSLAPALILTVLAAAPVHAQKSVTLTEPPTPLLPDAFGAYKADASATAPTSPLSLTTANKAALAEDSPSRSKITTYSGPKTLQLEAIEFGDKTGAYSAFTLLERPGMKQSKDLGDETAIGNDAVLFTAGATLVLAYPATAADIPTLKPLLDTLPKVIGNKNVPPLLPTMVTDKGLVPGSVRYAVGPESYAAQGGVLPAAQLGWDKSAEAVTAQYADKRGHETVTLLLYPTPTIAGNYLRTADTYAKSQSSNPNWTNAATHRDHELVVLANGTFSAEDTQKLLTGFQMHQNVSFDKDVQPVFEVEVHKTYSLLTQIVVFCCVGGLAAILLGLFLGFGRAGIRVLQGKPAAVEPEFLSLHLAPQNKHADLHQTDTPTQS